MLRKLSASFVAVKSKHIDKTLIAIHYASNKHQRNAVPHGDLLHLVFKKVLAAVISFVLHLQIVL